MLRQRCASAYGLIFSVNGPILSRRNVLTQQKNRPTSFAPTCSYFHPSVSISKFGNPQMGRLRRKAAAVILQHRFEVVVTIDEHDGHCCRCSAPPGADQQFLDPLTKYKTDFRIQLGKHLAKNLLQDIKRRQCAAIYPLRGHGVKHIGHGNNPGKTGDLFVAEPDQGSRSTSSRS